MKKLAFIILLLSFGINSFASPEEILIVSSKQTPDDSILLNQVKEAFLGNQQTFAQGGDVQALDRKTAPNDLRAKFFQTAAGMSNIQLKAYWSQRIFTGRGYPPRAADDFDALKKELIAKPGTIAFITPSELDPSLKVLLKIETK